ncbi:OmpA family protein [Oryzobacter telluris]|uniref:OmpA family protein n=1 Tax=Oryzobacter telluris TaxID=3149179 RepID=UPI00370DB589
MSETTRMLDDLVAALTVGSEEALTAALKDAVVEVHVDGSWLTFMGEERRTAAMRLLASFDDIAVTPVLRRATDTMAVQEAVVSGRHVGRFAGVEPSGDRVRINVSATALAVPDGSVARVRLTPDMSGLLGESARRPGSLGAAAALVAAVRENLSQEVAGWQEPVVAAPPPEPRRRSGRTVLAGVALLALLVAGGVGWWLTGGRPGTGAAAATPRPTPSTLPTSATPTPTPTPTPSPTPTEVPVIATATPSVAPTVQAGRQLVLTSDVLFSLGSADLTSSARQALLRLAGQVREAEVSGTVQVNGYTDNVGTPASNLALSRARALAVARVLQPALAGVPITLQPQGFGEASPVATNATPEGRAKNRRVTVVLPRQ